MLSVLQWILNFIIILVYVHKKCNINFIKTILFYAPNSQSYINYKFVLLSYLPCMTIAIKKNFKK